MRTNISEFILNQETKECVCFTLLGQQDHLDKDGYPICDQTEDKRVYAKKIKDKKNRTINKQNTFSFYIQSYPNNRLLNPIQIHSLATNNTSYIDKVCKGNISFIEVNESIFKKYINFLKTKNITWLNMAQREIK